MSSSPRIPLLPPDRWSQEARQAFASINPAGPQAELASAPNVAMIMAHHPPLAGAFFGLGSQLLMKSSLPDRLRELVTLRVVSRYKGGEYEWHHHVRFARAAGVTDAEIEAARSPLDDTILEGAELGALRAVDELLAAGTISDERWDELAARLDPRQMMDLVFTVGLYVMASFGNAALGVEIEDGCRSDEHPFT
jgi:alkylhydroperoxidase family enzyme